MLPVAAKRSVVQWELCSESDADVVLREHGVRGDDRVSVYVSDTAVVDGANGHLRIQREFRVNALMEVLELAAARVLDRRDRAVRHVQSVLGMQPEPAEPAASLYQLKYWIVPGDRPPLAVLCALAGMTRRPVSREWLMAEAGLGVAAVDVLLAKLDRLGALRTNPLPPAVPPQPSGLAARLRRWLRGGRAASLSPASP